MGKKIDLTGRCFGKLTVLSCTDKHDGSSLVWHCKCDCGREADIPARNLLHRGTVSCGCNRKSKAKTNLAGDIVHKLGLIEHTNASTIKSTRPHRNNKSGYRGVYWQRYKHGGGAWAAVIYFKRKQYRLGHYDTPEMASKAYLAAKDKIHGDFLKWYESIKGGVKNESD